MSKNNKTPAKQPIATTRANTRLRKPSVRSQPAVNSEDDKTTRGSSRKRGAKNMIESVSYGELVLTVSVVVIHMSQSF